MGNRALAHIEKIVKTYPIEGADKVEMAQVLDFHVMVKKGQFKVGELVTYIEVDSILPDGLSQNDLAEYTLTKLKISNSTEPDVIKELEKQLQEIL